MTAPELSPGRIIAQKYAVQAVLSRRPFAVTYEALTAPNKLCAVKMWDPAILRHPSALAELRDCEALAKELPDGTTIPILETGIDGETQAPFTATLLSDHPSLRSMVELCPLSPVETASMIRSLARSLDAAHRKDLLHLDLRPENVFVGPPPVCWTRPTDFGADIVERTLAPEHASWMVWASPEQIAQETVSPQSDVYVAALLGYFAMTGKHLHGIERPSRIDRAELERRQRDAPPRVSEEARRLSIDIPPALDVPFQRALSPSPINRFPTVLAFAEEIARALELPATAGASAFVDHLVGARDLGEALDGPRSQEAPPSGPGATSARPGFGHTGGHVDSGRHAYEDAPSELAHALVSSVPPPVVTTPPTPLPTPALITPPLAPILTERPTVPDAPASKGVSLAPPPPDHALDYRPPIQARALSSRRRGRAVWLTLGALLAAGAVGAGIFAFTSVGRGPTAVASTSSAAPTSGPTTAATQTPTTEPAPAASTPIANVVPTTPPPSREIIPGEVWYGEIVVHCEPTCETVLIQGGLVPANTEPKRMPPGTYSVTVRQEGMVKSQTIPLRASERLTVTFDQHYAPPPQYFNPRRR